MYNPAQDVLVDAVDTPFIANATTPFYVSVGCILCNAPETAAPTLIGTANENGEISSGQSDDYSCFFKKQPETDAELDMAARAMYFSCVECLRYRGTNEYVLKRLALNGCAKYCDVNKSNS